MKYRASMNFKYLILFAVGLFYSWNLSGQTKVTGTIIDGETKEPLPFVTIFTPKSSEGTVSDLEGKFEFIALDSIIQIQYLGYKTIITSIDLTQSAIQIDTTLFLDPDNLLISCPIIISTRTHKIHPSITYLDHKDIQLENETSIAPALNNTPGVFMHSGALNTNRITIRGIGNRNLFGTAKIKAYLDGIPLTNGSGETDLEDIDLSILDAITVYKGPASSIYGAGLGGMIHLQTPDNIGKSGNTLSIKSTSGSFGLSRAALTFSRANENKSIINLNFNNTASDGYRDNNRYRRQAFSGFGKLKINEKESVTMLFNYTFLSARIPSSLDSTDYVDNPEQAAFIWDRARGKESTERMLGGISYTAGIGDHLKQISAIHFNNRETYEKRPFNILDERSRLLDAKTEWILDYNLDGFISKMEFHLGGEIFEESYAWQTYDTNGQGSREEIISDNRENRFYSNLFAQAKFDLDYRATFTAGINRNFTDYEFEDYYETDGDQSGRRRFPVHYSPFFNLGLDLGDLLSLKQELSLSATVSHGFSPPTLEETLTPDGTINRSILPEQGWNYELGVRGSLQKLSYALSFYTMQIKDLLVARRSGFDQFIGLNAGKTSHNGVEVALKYNVKLGAFNIDPFLNYTFSDYTFDQFTEGDNDYSGNDLTGSAPHLLSSGFHLRHKNFHGNLVYRFVDAMPMRDDNSIYSDAYQLLNLKLGYKYKFSKKWELNLFAGVNNVLDEKYASMILINAGSFGFNAPRYYYPGLPRNFYLGLEVSFGK